jgi:hypothetical protein
MLLRIWIRQIKGWVDCMRHYAIQQDPIMDAEARVRPYVPFLA